MSTADSDVADGVTSRRNNGLLVLLFMVFMVTYREIILWNFSSHSRPNPVGWFYSLSDTSPQFLYLLAIGLFYFRRKHIALAFYGNGAPWSSLLFLIPGSLLLGWGHYISSVDVIYMSFLLVGFGAARFISGKDLTREIRIPTLILLLAVPLPAVLNSQIVFPFQLWTAEHSAWLLNTIGIPALLEGTDVVLVDHRYSVAESCTALGFIKWLLVFALVFVYMFRVSRLHSILLLLLAPLIAYAVNLLRAFTLILNPELDVLSLHLVQGIVFFMIGFALLYAADSFLRRFIASDTEVYSDSTVNAGGPGSEKQAPLLILLAWFTLLLLVSFALPRWPGLPDEPAREIRVAEQIGDWRMLRAVSEPRRFLGSVRYTSLLYRFYQHGRNKIGLFVGYDDRRNRNRSFLSPKNAYQGRMGLVEEQSTVYIDTIDKQVVTVLTDNEYGRILSYHWYVGVDSIAEEILRALMALDESPFRRQDGAFVIRLATNVALTADGLENADKRLREFLAVMRDELKDESGNLSLHGVLRE